jgi:predicted transport protein
VRRFVCGVPTNQLNKIFAPLYQQIKASASSFVDSVKDILEKRGYPKDYEFEKNLREAKLYGGGDRKEKTKFILETLEESFGHKEQVRFEKLEIEHVMPQTLTSWWETHLGENWEFVHETLLHTLGNLTLTGYNSNLSNSDFEEKKSRYKESRLELNAYFSDIETWRESDIQSRAQKLAKQCLEIWPYFGKDNLIQQSETQSERRYTFETMHNGDYLQGEILDLFEDFQDSVLKLGEVREEILRNYIAYRVRDNTFVSVVPLRSALKLYLNLPFNEVHHEGAFCRDVSNIGHWGVGDVEVKVEKFSDIGRVMPLVEKAYRRQLS